MTTIIRDSWDFYGAVADAGQNYWDVATSNSSVTLSSAQTPFGVGQSLAIVGNSNTISPVVQKAYSSNEATSFAAFRLRVSGGSGATPGMALHFTESGTVQCSVYFCNDGAIRFYRGTSSGTLLATYTSAFSASAWTQFQVKVIVDSSAGEIHIRKNGNTSDDFSATSLNTRSTSNNYSNGFTMVGGNTGGGSPDIFLDDFWLWSGNAGAVPHDWIGDFRAVQVMPNGDTADKDFTPNVSTLSLGQQTITSTQAYSANTQTSLQKFTTKLPGTVSKATLNFNASATGHVNVAIYDSTGAGGGPGAPITHGTATAVTNPAGGNSDFNFGTPPTLAANTTYWIVGLSDVAFTLKSDASSVTQYTQSETYGSGFTNPMTLTSTSLKTSSVALTFTPSGNFAYVQELLEDGVTTFLSDGTAGDLDLYTNPGLATSPTAILGVSVRAFASKSDAGARTGTVQIKSGSTAQDGPTVALTTTFENVTLLQDVDPNTGSAWTATNLANAKFGPKVVS